MDVLKGLFYSGCLLSWLVFLNVLIDLKKKKESNILINLVILMVLAIELSIFIVIRLAEKPMPKDTFLESLPATILGIPTGSLIGCVIGSMPLVMLIIQKYTQRKK